MHSFSLVSICAALITVAACSNTSSDPSGGEIRSEADVQRLFEAIMPDLLKAFTELADDQFGAKADEGPSVQCPGGGSIDVNLISGQTTLAECSGGGATISGTVVLSVQSIPPSSYEALFSGVLTVTGSFTGTIDVFDAMIQWSVPATEANTYWSVTVRIGEEYVYASSDDSGGGGGGGGGGDGVTCNCTGSGGPSSGTDNRIHISNISNQAGIQVVLTAGDQVCTIDQLIVSDPSGGIELDQCVMNVGVGDAVTIAATTAAAVGGAATCVVDATAIVPGLSGPQTFANVFTQPVSVMCDLGFAF
jgi:hypothetical protein